MSTPLTLNANSVHPSRALTPSTDYSGVINLQTSKTSSRPTTSAFDNMSSTEPLWGDGGEDALVMTGGHDNGKSDGESSDSDEESETENGGSGAEWLAAVSSIVLDAKAEKKMAAKKVKKAAQAEKKAKAKEAAAIEKAEGKKVPKAKKGKARASLYELQRDANIARNQVMLQKIREENPTPPKNQPRP
jgi:hypothetical protein